MFKGPFTTPICGVVICSSSSVDSYLGLLSTREHFHHHKHLDVEYVLKYSVYSNLLQLFVGNLLGIMSKNLRTF